MYIHPESGRVFADHSAIRAGLTNALFPEVITDEMLAYHDIIAVAQVIPVVGPGQVAEAAAPVLIDDVWTEVWVVRDETADEAIAKIAEAIPMLNLQLVLIDDDKLDTVKATLDSMEGADGAKARAYWIKALTARRDNYLVNLMWPLLYTSEAEFNAAWARAAAMNP